MESKGLTKAQIELLKALSFIKTDEEVLEFKEALAALFKKKAQSEKDRLWEASEWNMEKLETLKTKHFRTPSK